MRVLIVDSECLGLDFALRCLADGHQVRWYRASSTPLRDGEGFKGMAISDDWRKDMEWVSRSGLVFLTGNSKFLVELDRYRDMGFKIFGPTKASANLEIDRGKGMSAMKACGIDIPPYKTFDSLHAAEAFARKSDKSWVFKPLGDTEDKSLTYVSNDPADLCGWLQRRIKAGQKVKSCMLQEKIDMLCELGVSGWFGPEGFLKDKWQIAFEFKKLMPGDIGPNCFTPDGEVLTKDGWKFWPDVTMEDEVCTLIDGKIEFEKPSQLVVGDFEGELVGWKSPTIDILVTPGHNMYVQDSHYRRPFFFESAIEASTKSRTVMRAGGVWSGHDTGVTPQHAALVGAYIADGNCHKGSVEFGNCPSHKQIIFTEIARKAGYIAKMYSKDLYINSKSLVNELLPLGKCSEKRVPRNIMDSSPEVISGFLMGYGAGDGSSRINNKIYTTTSKGLSDDLQELCLKVGLASGITERDRRGESHIINGYNCINKLIAYDIGCGKRTKAEISPRNLYKQKYTGKVYCVTVTSHIIFTRRNGRACWIGQTGEQGTVTQYMAADKLADECLTPMAGVIGALGHRGDFAVGVGIDKKGKAWPFEFTARAGWPALMNQIASHDGDVAQWMLDLLDGHDTLKVTNDVCVSVVCGQPPYPANSGPAAVCEGNPISIADDVWDDIHPCAVMLKRGPKLVDGTVVDGPAYQTTGPYVLVATGLGKTVSKAQADVYDTVKDVKFPNMMYRNDIGNSLKAKLPKLHKFGYASNMEF